MKTFHQSLWRLIIGAAIVGFLPAFTAKVMAQKPGPVYGNVRYEDDYSFLNNAENRGNDLFNSLKKIPVGSNVELTFGGHYRFRFERDSNRRFGASNPQSQSFFLNRLFLFADLHLGNRVRLFSEFKYAGITDNELPAPVTAHDKPDVQNLFADVWLLSTERSKVGLRAGRQELQFGKQRLISPLDWVNTRRAFDGFRVMTNLSGWKFDGFVTRPLEFDPEEVNNADESQTFAGIYAQRQIKAGSVSAFYLLLKEADPIIRDSKGAPGDFRYHTLGLAFDGNSRGFDWSTEAAYQSGSFGSDDISAFMVSLDGGYTLSKLPMKPRVGLGCDIASGDENPTDTKKQTFHQLFPLGHAYFGWADQVGRQNIRAISLLLTAKPHKRLVAKLNAFKFDLDEKRDALYNAGGGVVRRDATGAAGSDAGSEIDAALELTINVHVGIQLGFARFIPGDFIKKTGSSKTHTLLALSVPVKF